MDYIQTIPIVSGMYIYREEVLNSTTKSIFWMCQQNNIGYKQIKIKKNYFIKSRNSMKFSFSILFSCELPEINDHESFLIYRMLFKYMYSSNIELHFTCTHSTGKLKITQKQEMRAFLNSCIEPPCTSMHVHGVSIKTFKEFWI